MGPAQGQEEERRMSFSKGKKRGRIFGRPQVMGNGGVSSREDEGILTSRGKKKVKGFAPA